MADKASFSTRLPTDLITRIKSKASKSKMTIADFMEHQLSNLESEREKDQHVHDKVNEIVLGASKETKQIQTLLENQYKILSDFDRFVEKQDELMMHVHSCDAKINQLKVSVEVPNNSHASQLLEIIAKQDSAISYFRSELSSLKYNLVISSLVFVSGIFMYLLYQHLS